MEDCSLLHELLDAVAKKPLSFAVPLIALESIVEALSTSSVAYLTVSEHSLLPFTWVETGVARQLHCDGISALLKDSHAIQFQKFEGRQLENCLRADCCFGSPPVELHEPLLYLRPTTSPLLTGCFGLKGFNKVETVPLDVHEYLVVSLAAKAPKWSPIALETVVEAQEMEDWQTAKLPRSELACK